LPLSFSTVGYTTVHSGSRLRCTVPLRTYKVVPNRDDVVVDLDYDAAGELA
jgi:hypothetical protein